jgi:uncharacterized membrane protein required for colicin V production
MEINWLFVAVVILFAVLIISGWYKGFLRTVISFAGTIVVIIAVVFVSPKVSSFVIENTDLYERTREKVTAVFIEKLTDNGNEADDNGLKDLNVPDILKNDFIEKNASEMYQALLTTVFKEYISGYIAKLAINAGCFVAVYLVFIILKWILLRTSDIISKIPVIKGINRILGAAIGTAEALIITWIFFFIIIMFLGNEFGGKLLSGVQKSVFLTYLFNQNLLFRFIS